MLRRTVVQVEQNDDVVILQGIDGDAAGGIDRDNLRIATIRVGAKPVAEICSPRVCGGREFAPDAFDAHDPDVRTHLSNATIVAAVADVRGIVWGTTRQRRLLRAVVGTRAAFGVRSVGCRCRRRCTDSAAACVNAA